MDSLPWLIRYGDVIWPTGLVILVVGFSLLAPLVFRGSIRAKLRARAHSLPRASRSLAGRELNESVALYGRLCAEGQAAERFEDGGPCAAATVSPRAGPDAAEDWTAVLAHDRAETLTLVLRDETVGIEGPVQVLIGSQELRPDRPLGAGSDRVLRRILAHLDHGVSSALASGHGALLSLEAGDTVIAYGRLVSSVADAPEGGYRVSARRWAIAPMEQRGGLDAFRQDGHVVLACAGMPRSSRSAAWFGMGALAGAAVFVAVFVVVPELCVMDTRASLQRLPSGPVTEPRIPKAAEVAATGPFARRRALQLVLRSFMVEAPQPSERGFAMAWALRDLARDQSDDVNEYLGRQAPSSP